MGLGPRQRLFYRVLRLGTGDQHVAIDHKLDIIKGAAPDEIGHGLVAHPALDERGINLAFGIAQGIAPTNVQRHPIDAENMSQEHLGVQPSCFAQAIQAAGRPGQRRSQRRGAERLRLGRHSLAHGLGREHGGLVIGGQGFDERVQLAG